MLDLVIAIGLGYVVGFLLKSTAFAAGNGVGGGVAFIIAAVGWIIAVIAFNIFADLYLHVARSWAGASAGLFALGLFGGVKSGKWREP